MIVALVLATVAAAQQIPPATLCIDGTCRPNGEARVIVAPSEVARHFVWISGDAARAIAGVIPASLTIVPLEQEGSVSHTITVATSDGSRNVVPALELKCGEAHWTWSLPQMPQRKLEIVRPPGACSLAVGAPDYKTITKELTPTDLGSMTLHRLPVIAGTITDASSGSPVAGAEIFLPDNELLTVSDAAGRFRAVIDRPWPNRLRVESAGRARQSVSVPKAVADVDLPITLFRGGSVRLHLAPPLGQEPLQWELRRIIRDTDDEKVKAGSVEAGESTIAITGISPGDHRVVILGDGPLQRLAVVVTVVDGVGIEATAQITSSRLDLEVARGGKPLSGATVNFIVRAGSATWRSKLTVDDEGKAAEEIWQAGDYLAAVDSYTERRRLDGEEKIAWTLDIPERVIEGRVADATTGKAIPKALILLTTDSGVTGTRTDSDGAYKFESVIAGKYSLTARVQGYQELITPKAPLAEEARLETRDLRLQPVNGHVLRAVSTAGAPIPSALVYVSSRYGVRAAGLTAEDGRITLPLSFDEYGQVYVMPRSGSFAVARFASMAERGVEELVVPVPEGSASLEIRTIAEDGTVIAGMSFLMRVNGLVVPLQVKEEMSRYQGLPMSSDAQGRLVLSRLPQGRYELWPLASRADYVAVSSPSPPPAPVNVILMAGHQVAKMVFKPK